VWEEGEGRCGWRGRAEGVGGREREGGVLRREKVRGGGVR
jgi:hypothetical protein